MTINTQNSVMENAGQLSHLYDGAAESSKTIKTPAISVGSMTMGADGKLEVMAKLSQVLQKNGYSTTILKQGNRGIEKVDSKLDNKELINTYGKDVYRLTQPAEASSLVLAEDRIIGTDYIKETTHPDVIILDEAFHPPLSDNILKILVVNSDYKPKKRHFFQSKTDRASLKLLRRADLILVDKNTDIEIIHYMSQFAKVEEFSFEYEVPGKEVVLQPATAFCEMKQSDAFHWSLIDSGHKCENHIVYKDNINFSRKKIKELKELDSKSYLCTEQGYSKLPKSFKKENHTVILNKTVGFIDEASLLNTVSSVLRITM